MANGTITESANGIGARGATREPTKLFGFPSLPDAFIIFPNIGENGRSCLSITVLSGRESVLPRRCLWSSPRAPQSLVQNRENRSSLSKRIPTIKHTHTLLDIVAVPN